MFLNYIKNFLIKKTLKNSLQDSKMNHSLVLVQTIGLLVDVTDFAATESLIAALLANGILENNIKTIVYCAAVKKKEGLRYPTFNGAQLKWNGEVRGFEVNEFSKEKFDLLISFYDVEKAILMQITHNSKAQFKVGFSSIDKRLNHFIIKTDINNDAIFIKELFKYLKLLNKI